MSEEVQDRIEKMIKKSEAILNAGKEKLKPCPFCGGEAYANETDWKGWWHGWVICEKCGVKIDKQTKDEAIEAWNRRYKEQDDEKAD